MEQIDEKDIDNEVTPERKVLSIVLRDWQKSKKFLKKFHEECVDRIAHYRASKDAQNIGTAKSFPVPFTTEQVDLLVSDIMDKLWFKNEPCTIMPREDSDREDASAKTDFMQYQDYADNMFSKTEIAARNCAICRIAPAVVNYKEEYETVVREIEEPLTYDDGTWVMADGVNPVTVPQKVVENVPVYQGASVELIDPLDFFFTPEKSDIYDEHPFIIRSRRTVDFFKSKPYFIPEAVQKLVEKERQSREEEDDLHDEKREAMGYDTGSYHATDDIIYLEWYGYCDPNNTGEKSLYIIGVADDDIVVRMDNADGIFKLGKPNVVVGVIEYEQGEVLGVSLLDKIHGIQHAQDSLVGMYFKNMRQSVNKQYAVNKNSLLDKRFVNDAGELHYFKEDPRQAIMEMNPTPISKDLYDGLAMFRLMGQNSSGINDSSEGIAQEGVETAQEANLLQSRSSLRLKRYLRVFEESFIEPLWKMRNQVNMRFCDVGYVYRVIGDGAIFWRTIEPGQIQADVDFICEASSRETQRGVLAQQIIQAINLGAPIQEKMLMAGVPMQLTPNILELFAQFLEEGLGWKTNKVEKIIPRRLIEQVFGAGTNVPMGAGGMGGAGVVPPQTMPQPRNQAEVDNSAQQKTNMQPGRMN